MVRRERGNSHDELSIPIGPSPKERRRRQQEALKSEGERITSQINRMRELEGAMKEIYGEDLVDFGRAYSERVRPDNHGLVHLRGQMLQVEEVRPLFARALIEKLEAQPVETRVDWMDGFLEDLGKLSPPQR